MKKGKQESLRNKVVSAYLYLRFAHDRGRNHVDIFLSLAGWISSFAVLLKLSGVSIAFIIPLGVLMMAVITLGGHFDIRYGVAEKDTSLRNAYNREMQRLLKR